MKTICEYLNDDKKKWAELPYIFVKKNGKFSGRNFSEIVDDVEALAAALIYGNLSGKNIMLFSPNSYEWAVIALSVMGYVGTLVPIDKEWTSFDVENALSAIEINAVFYDASKENVISEIREKYPTIKFFRIDETFGEFIKKGQTQLPPAGIHDLNARAMIIFTSGTTSFPKAIPLTQSNIFNNRETLQKRTPMSAEDRTYIFLPLNHVYAGIAQFLYTIISGMRVYICSDISLIAEEMLEIRPTIVCTVPLILNRLFSVMNDEIMEMLRNVRFLYCGGSFTDIKIKKFFLENGVNIIEAYGTSETSSVIALGLPFDEKINSAGVIFENLDVKIIDPDENGVGEIIVGGGSVSSGYISGKNDNSAFDGNGYYHTGDLGYIDETGHLYLKGRKKRIMITANGKNVYADEIEGLLLEYPQIKAAAVYEEDHHIAAKIYSEISEEKIKEIICAVNKKLPHFKQIKILHLKADKIGGRIK